MQRELRKRYTATLLSAGVILLFFAAVFSISVGSIRVPFGEVLNILFGGEAAEALSNTIVMDIRLPRVLATLIGGACLAASGVLLQVFFNNPIVEPYILGISSGSNLFVGIVMLLGFRFGFNTIDSLGMFLGSFVGAMLVMLIVIAVSQRVKSVVTLLIIGLMFGYVCSAATGIMTAMADKERIANFTLWTMGSFQGFLWADVKILAIIGLPFVFLASLLSKPLNTMLLGEKYAVSMGLHVKRFRLMIVLISSVLTAVVTAFAGPVSFVGLAAPHIVRISFKSSNNRIVIPAACLFGAIMTTVCDLGTRTLLAPLELPLGAMTSLIGAPILVFLLLRRKGSEL